MKQRPPATPRAGRYTVDAAAKALELLNAFSFKERSFSLSDLAGRTGIPRATAFRLLSTLDHYGFISKAGAEYHLGIRCLVLGNVVAADLDVREKAHPHLVALRDVTREPHTWRCSINGRSCISSACRHRSPWASCSRALAPFCRRTARLSGRRCSHIARNPRLRPGPSHSLDNPPNPLKCRAPGRQLPQSS